MSCQRILELISALRVLWVRGNIGELKMSPAYDFIALALMTFMTLTPLEAAAYGL